MASGSYGGAGIDVPDLLLYAGLAVGAYFVYKTIIKPASEVTGAVGNITTGAGSIVVTGEDAFKNMLKAEGDFFTQRINDFSGLLTGFSSNIDKIGDAFTDSLTGNKKSYDLTIIGPYTKTEYHGTYGGGNSLNADDTKNNPLAIGFSAKNSTFTTVGMAQLNVAIKQNALDQMKGPIKLTT